MASRVGQIIGSVPTKLVSLPEICRINIPSFPVPEMVAGVPKATVSVMVIVPLAAPAVVTVIPDQ